MQKIRFSTDKTRGQIGQQQTMAYHQQLEKKNSTQGNFPTYVYLISVYLKRYTYLTSINIDN